MRAEINDPRLPARFWSKVSLDPDSGCWLWTGATGSAGYGHLKVEGRAREAHRIAYQELVGPVPDGLECDHLCRVRSCVNPAHIEPVTKQVNILRGLAPSAAHSRKTSCPRGHAYSGENILRRSNGHRRPGRRCRECERLRGWRRRMIKGGLGRVPSAQKM